VDGWKIVLVIAYSSKISILLPINIFSLHVFSFVLPITALTLVLLYQQNFMALWGWTNQKNVL
jgi:hypothetical protein